MVHMMQKSDHRKRVCLEVIHLMGERKRELFSGLGWPDEKERAKKAVDVNFSGEGSKYVMEHTQIESFPKQIADGVRIMQLLYPLEKSLSDCLPGPGHYQLSVVFGAIEGSMDYDKIRSILEKWIREKVLTLEIGSPVTAPRHCLRETPPGLPFEVSLYRWPGRDGVFRIYCFVPEKINERRRERIKIALEDKCPKLKFAKINADAKSILVFESNDIALGNYVDIATAVIEEISKRSDDIPDEIYLVETEIDPWVIWVLKEGQIQFPNVINPGPRYVKI